MKVAIFQPSIPLYRVPLFAALDRLDDISLRVFASKDLQGAAPNAKGPFPFQASFGRASAFFNGKVFWQYGFSVPSDFGPGDVIVISGNIRLLSNYSLIWAARRRRVGILWWGHGWSSISTRLSVALRRLIMSVADAILLYTDKEVNAFGCAAIKRQRRIFGANNTIDVRDIETEKVKWASADIAGFKRQHEISGTFNLLFCSRLTRDRGLDLLLRAMERLKRSEQAVRLIVIGDGPNRQSLEEMADRLGISQDILWTGGVYEEHRLAPWFLSADLFVYPGPIGLSLLHAFAYGVPVLTNDDARRHKPEFAALKDGINGITFQVGDVDSLVSRIRAVQNDEDMRLGMSRAAYSTIRDDFSMENMVKNVHDAICCAARPGKRLV